VPVLRLIYARPALLLMTGLFLALGLAAAWHHLTLRLLEMEGLAIWPPGTDDSFSVMLIAFGVLLEERDALFRRIYAQPPDAADKALNHQAHLAGALILIIGLFIELADVIDPLIQGWMPALGAAAGFAAMALHAAGAWVMARFLWDARHLG